MNYVRAIEINTVLHLNPIFSLICLSELTGWKQEEQTGGHVKKVSASLCFSPPDEVGTVPILSYPVSMDKGDYSSS